EALGEFNWLFDWLFRNFSFLKDNQDLNGKIIALSEHFFFEIILVRWLDYLDGNHFISLLSNSVFLDKVYGLLTSAFNENNKFIIPNISTLLNRFLLLQKDNFESFIKSLSEGVYDYLIKTFKALLIHSTKEYLHLVK
ncbi:hypothetical protein LCGC14_2676870, partial [marine sediment metagenome]